MTYETPKVKRYITLEKARENIGRYVIYQSHAGANRERGCITSVGSEYVFVRFDGDSGSKATSHERLYFEIRDEDLT